MISLLLFLGGLNVVYSAASITGITGPAVNNKGVATTFTCATNLAGETVKAGSYVWLKDDNAISGQTADKYGFTPVDTTFTGNYKCKVTFSSTPEQTSNPHAFTVRALPADSTTYIVQGTAETILTCEYNGDATAALKWFDKDNQEIGASNIPKVVPTVGAYNGGTKKQTATLKLSGGVATELEAKQPYKCTVTFSAGGAITSTFNVNVLTVVLTGSATTLNKDQAATMTCAYEFESTGTKPTITWKHKAQAFSTAQNALVSDVADSGNTGKKLYTIAKTALTDTGKYTCIATYAGSKVGTSTDKALYVRMISAASAHTILAGTPSTVLTCTVNGDEPDLFKFYYDGSKEISAIAGLTLKNSNYDATAFTKDVTLTIANAAAAQEQAYTCKATWDKTSETSVFTVSILTVVLAADQPKVNKGAKVIFTCAYEFVSADAKPTITWKHKGQEFSSDQNKLVTDAADSGKTGKKLFTLASTVVTDNGEYVCIGTYTTGKVTSAGATLAVREIPAASSHTIVGGEASTVLTCKVLGDNPTKIKWYFENTKEVADGNTITGVTPKYDIAYNAGTFTKEITLTIANAAAAQEKVYICQPEWSSTVQKSEFTVSILTVGLTLSKAKLNEDDAVTFTCAYEFVDVSSKPTITWTQNTKAFSSDQNKLVTDGADSGKVGKKLYTIAKSVYTDNGDYKCTGTYADLGNKAATQTAVKLYVRKVPDDSNTIAVEGTSSTVLTCKVYGDEPSLMKWYYNTNTELTSQISGVTPKLDIAYNAGTFSKEITLTMANAAAAQAKDYLCKATWDGQIQQSKFTFGVLATVKIDASTTAVYKGGAFVVYCTYTYLSGVPKPAISWTLNGKDFTTEQNARVASGGLTDTTEKLLYIKTGATGTDSGEYKCSAMYQKPASSPGKVVNIRQLASATTAYIPLTTASTVLTCTVYGDNPNEIKWYIAGSVMNGAANGVTPGYSGGYSSYTKKITLTFANAAAAQAKNYTCKVTWSDGTLSSEYTVDILTNTGLVNKPSAALQTKGANLTFTCEYEFDPSGSKPTIKWLRNAAEQSTGISSGADVGNKGYSKYTITGAAGTDSGKYECTATYGSIVNKGTATYTLNVRDVTAPATTYKVDGTAALTFNVVFYGDAVGTVKWYKGSDTNALTTTGDYTVTPGTYASNKLTTTLKIATLAAADSAAYKCEAVYTSGSVKKSTIQTLAVLTVALTSSDATADKGDALTLTCAHSAVPGGVTTTWTRNGETFTDGVSAPSTTQSLYTAAQAETSDNGDYKCNVKFGSHGNKDSSTVTQYVRDSATSTPTAYAFAGLATYTLSCVFRGDDLAATAWTKASAALSDGTDYTITAGTYAKYVRTDTLTIKTITSADAGSYKCEAAYKTGGTKTSATSVFSVAGISSVAAASTTVDSGSGFSITCTYTTTTTPTIAWYLGSAKATSGKVTAPSATTSVYTVTSATMADNGIYKCKATYPSFGMTTGDPVTMNVRHVKVGAAVSYVLASATTATITCTFYGDALGATVWTKGTDTTSLKTDTTNYTVSAGEYGSRKREDKLTIKTLSFADAGKYKCEATYTSGSAKKSAEQTLTVLGVSKTASDDTTVSKGKSFKVTCDYTTLASDAKITPTVTWMKGSSAVTDTSLVSSPSSGKSAYTVSSANVTDSAKYRCKIAYGTYGTYDQSGSGDYVMQYVRHITASATTYGVKGNSVTMTCKINGDATSTPSWFKGTNITVLSSGGDVTVNAGSYSSSAYEIESTLVIKNLEAADAAAYKCNASYTAGTTATKTTQTLTVTSSTPTVNLTNSASAPIEKGASFTLTCAWSAMTLSSTEGTLSVIWSKDSKVITPKVTTNKASNNETYAISNATSSDNGIYKCSVKYGVYGTTDAASSKTQNVRSVAMAAVTSGVKGKTITLTCTVYGDQANSLSFKNGSAAITDDSDYDIVDGGYKAATFSQVKSLKILTSESGDAGNYTCAVKWTASPALTNNLTGEVKVSTVLSTPTLAVTSAYITAGSALTINITVASASAAEKPVTVKMSVDGTLKSTTKVSDVLYQYKLSSVDHMNSGSYKSKVTYGSYGSIESAATAIYIRQQTAAATTYGLVGNTVTLACVFYGDAMGQIKFYKGASGSALASGGDYTFTGGSYSSGDHSASSSLKIANLESADAAVYNCKATYTQGSKEKTSAQTLSVLATTIAASSAKVVPMTAVTLTCAYSTAVTSTIKWYKDGTAITANTTTLTISTSNGASKLVMSAKTTTTAISGTYKVKVTYGSHGSKEQSTTLAVEGIDTITSGTYIRPGVTTTLTCVLYSSGSATFAWSKGDSALQTDSSYTIKTGTYDSSAKSQKSILTVYTVDSLDSGTYKCKASSKTGSQVLHVIKIATEPSNVIAEVGGKATMSCKTSETLLTIAEVNWKSGATKLYSDKSPTKASGTHTGQYVFTSSYTLTSKATDDDNTTIYCSVVLSTDDTVDSNNATYYRVGFKNLAITGYSGTFIESDKKTGQFSENYTVTAYVYKKPGVKSITGWFTNTKGTKASVNFTAGTVSGNVVPYTYSPPDAKKESGKFKVEIVYTNYTAKTFNRSIAQKVFKYCKISNLPTESNGVWNPATMVPYKGVAKLTCNSDYYMKGGKVRCSHTNGTFTGNTPSCISTSGRVCGDMPDTENGYVEYDSTTSSKYQCNTGYSLLGTQQTYTCDTSTKKWSIYANDNQDGVTPTCQKVNEPKERTVAISIKFSAGGEYCKDTGEKDKFKAALKTSLEDADLADCLKNDQCEMIEFTCTYAASVLTVGFKLNQTFDLTDPTVVTTDATAISAASSNITVSIAAKRKRSTTTFGSTSSTATTSTTCDSNYIEVDGNCIQCAMGYGVKSGACEICAIGYYNSELGVSACSQCSDSKTTVNIGTRCADKCLSASELCTVPSNPSDGSLSPTTGSSVAISTTVTVTCSTDYAVQQGTATTFSCNSATSSAVTSPKCYRACSLSTYTDTKMAAIFMEKITSTSLQHAESITVSCLDGYRHKTNKTNHYSVTCNGAGTTAEATVSFGECTKPLMTTFIICVAVIAVLLVVSLVLLCLVCKKKRAPVEHIEMRGPPETAYKMPMIPFLQGSPSPQPPPQAKGKGGGRGGPEVAAAPADAVAEVDFFTKVTSIFD